MLGRVSVEFNLRHYHMLETDSQLERDDLSHDKPFPDLFLAAAERPISFAFSPASLRSACT